MPSMPRPCKHQLVKLLLRCSSQAKCESTGQNMASQHLWLAVQTREMGSDNPKTPLVPGKA